jgi:hypothetical protein
METVKVEVEFEKQELSEIEALMERKGVARREDFLNNAIALLKWAIREQDEGRSVASVDRKNKTVRPVLLKAFPSA